MMFMNNSINNVDFNQDLNLRLHKFTHEGHTFVITQQLISFVNKTTNTSSSNNSNSSSNNHHDSKKQDNNSNNNNLKFRNALFPQNHPDVTSNSGHRRLFEQFLTRTFNDHGSHWHQIEHVCRHRSGVDAVAFTIEVEERYSKRSLIGGCILSLVESQDDYLPLKGNVAFTSSSSSSLENKVLSRIWIPWLSISCFPIYDSEMLAATFWEHVSLAIAKLRALTTAFGSTVEGIDIRTPPQKKALRVLKEIGGFSENSTFLLTLSKNFVEIAAAAKNEPKEKKNNNNNNNNNNNSGSKTNDQKLTRTASSSSTSTSKKKESVAHPPEQTKTKTKNNNNGETHQEEKQQTEPKKSSSSSSTSGSGIPHFSDLFDEEKFCKEIPEDVLNGNIRLRLAHDRDEAKEWTQLVEMFGVNGNHNLNGVSSSGWESDLRIVAYLPRDVEREKREEEAIDQLPGLQRINARKILPFKTAATFTPTDEYINCYMTNNDPEMACRIKDRKSRTLLSINRNDSSSNNGGTNSSKSYHHQQVMRIKNDENDDSAEKEKTPRELFFEQFQESENIVGLISITKQGFVPFVWVHEKLQQKGFGRLLFGIVAEWLRIRELLLCFMIKRGIDVPLHQSHRQNPFGWMAFGEEWDLKRAATNFYNNNNNSHQTNKSSSTFKTHTLISPEMRAYITEQRTKHNKNALDKARNDNLATLLGRDSRMMKLPPPNPVSPITTSSNSSSSSYLYSSNGTTNRYHHHYRHQQQQFPAVTTTSSSTTNSSSSNPTKLKMQEMMTELRSAPPQLNDVAFYRSRLVTRFSLCLVDNSCFFRRTNDPFVARVRQFDSNPCGPHVTKLVQCQISNPSSVNNCHRQPIPPPGKTTTTRDNKAVVDQQANNKEIRRVAELHFVMSCLEEATGRQSSFREGKNNVAFGQHQRAAAPRFTADFDPSLKSVRLSKDGSGQEERAAHILVEIDHQGKMLCAVDDEPNQMCEVSLIVLQKSNLRFYERLGFQASGTRGDDRQEKKGKGLIHLNPKKREISLDKKFSLSMPQLPCALGELVPQLNFDFVKMLNDSHGSNSEMESGKRRTREE